MLAKLNLNLLPEVVESKAVETPVSTSVASETAVLNCANVPVKVLFAKLTDLFVNVSVVSFNTIVPVAFGIVTVLSAVGFSTVKTVSWSSEVVPSNVNEFVISIVLESITDWVPNTLKLPVTVKLPGTVTALGKLKVKVSPDWAVVIWFVVPLTVNVSPKSIAVLPESPVKVIVEFDNEPFAIFVNVLSGPLIVLFVKVVVEGP